jgi:phenylacetate-CoA ligase
MRTDPYGSIFRSSILPILDRLNGTDIDRKLRLLQSWEHLDPGEIRARQDRRLEDVVAGARKSCPFYAERWGRKELGPSSAYGPLSGLPVITKADLRDAAGSFPVHGNQEKVVASRTSGSTGSPMIFYRSVEQESWFWALRMRIWGWAGYRPGDPYLTINLNPRLAWKKRIQDVLFRCTYLTFNADNQDSARIVEVLRSRRIPNLNGFSSSLFVLARYMKERGIPNPGVSGVTSTGDTLFPEYREAVESAFGTRVLDYYGAGGEGLHLASQCPQSGSRYHLHPENAVVEILDDEGPAAPGIPGRIVVTQLDNPAMPLIRYELGDVAVGAPDGIRCECGRTLPMLERIEGRIPDLIVAPDGTFLVMHFFVVLFKNLQQVDRYQILQDRKETIVARLVARPGADRSGIEAAVRKAVSEATRGTLGTEFQWLEEIPLSGAGKRRLVISRFGREALMARPASSSGSGRP